MNGECVPCAESEGRIVDSRGRCVCNSELGYTMQGDICVLKGCRVDDECDDRSRCINGTCVNACEAEPCGLYATCDAVGHRSHCTCITGYVGNARVQCNANPPETNYRTDFPLPDMKVKYIFQLLCIAPLLLYQPSLSHFREKASLRSLCASIVICKMNIILFITNLIF